MSGKSERMVNKKMLQKTWEKKTEEAQEILDTLKDTPTEQRENAILLLRGFNLGVESERRRSEK